MSAFSVERNGSRENLIGEGNIPAIPPAQKDNSISLPESPDLSFQLKSPGTPEAGSNLLR
eukprot:CAMPEP_0173208548 /NCGR_PEP_ID=MMETSP1141-20130122/22584_1 /TAXON_ID=483371 /ORGANISM="non described non described, Strain CCMP2298" /LENGTH=59 /DNA_ID=CAMNT_0014135025 /DNA_START=25 /DNA_END=200 /DNA_ORIENTATION=-